MPVCFLGHLTPSRGTLGHKTTCMAGLLFADAEAAEQTTYETQCDQHAKPGSNWPVQQDEARPAEPARCPASFWVSPSFSYLQPPAACRAFGIQCVSSPCSVFTHVDVTDTARLHSEQHRGDASVAPRGPGGYLGRRGTWWVSSKHWAWTHLTARKTAGGLESRQERREHRGRDRNV